LVCEMTEELSAAQFGQAIQDVLVIVDFWAPWCMPCRKIAPAIDELSAEYEGKASVYKINIDENREVAVQYQVMSIPTLLIFKKGQLVDRITGALPKDKIDEKIKQYL
jgi:thioredoxin 1